MALRILQFGILFAIGFRLGPTSLLARALDTPEIALSLKLTDPQDVIVLKGQSATLRCDAVSYLNDLQITWLHNDAPVSANDTRWSQQPDGSLYIPKIISGKKSNGVTGQYECLATNKMGTLRSGTAKLKVAALDITRSPSNQAIPEFQPALLNCSIHSTPPAEIQWEFNNKPLPQNTRYVPLPNGALLISSTHKSDEGSYRCKATNNILNKYKYSKAAVLSVSQPMTEAKPPTFLPLNIAPNNTVYVGENLDLYCAVMGWPKPTVQWLNNDSAIIGNSTGLRILHARPQDRGNYTCLAYDDSKDRINQTFRVEVLQKPQFNVTPVSRAYPVAKTVRLECQAFGMPEPRTYWLKNGQPLVYKNHIKKHATGLVFSHTFSSDSGIYQCVAANTAGKIWTAAKIEIDDSHSPRPPEHLQCRPYDASTICLSWRTPENVIAQAYSVYSFYKGQARDESGPEYLTNMTYQEAGGLNSSTNYTFYVRLYSRVASDRSDLVTCEAGVKGDRNLDIVPVGPNSVSLKWSEVSSDVPCNGSETSYKVQWRRQSHSTINVERTAKKSHVVTGLLPGTNYEFRITSTSYDKDDNGDSWTLYTHSKTENSIYVNNEEVNSTNGTDAVPSVPEQLEGTPDSPTSIRLIWGDVANKKHYVVCYVPIREGGRCEDGKLVKSFSSTIVLPNLKPNTTYEFKVQTHNLEGISGPFSKSIEVHTPPDVPSPVLDLQYKALNDTAACLHWKAPEHKNGKLQKYVVSYTPDKNRRLEDWIDVSVPTYQRKTTACWLGDPDTVSSVLSNLTSNVYYTVLVRAVSDVGVGKPTVPIEVITNPQDATEEQPPNLENEMEYHKKVGVIVGVIMALMCVACCITCILVRRRCLKHRAMAGGRAASNNYYPAVAHYASHVGSVQVRLEDPCAAELHEIQHLVAEGHSTHIPPISPSHLDTKGGEEFPNGHVNGSAKPYTNGHLSNGYVHITENPQFFAFESSNGHAGPKRSKHSPAVRYEEDSNSNVRPSKFYDLYRLFENSKRPANPDGRHQCNPHFERKGGSANSLRLADLEESPPPDDDDKQLTCLDDSLSVSVVNNYKRISPVLGPNG